MAVVTRTIKSSGGDYTSLSAAESGEQAIRADLVTRDEQLDLECHAMIDTAAVVVDGFTSDATRYIRIYAAAGAEAKCPIDTANSYTLRPTNVLNCLSIQDPYTRVDGIQIQSNFDDNNLNGIQVGSGYETRIIRCVITTMQAGTYTYGNVSWAINCGTDQSASIYVINTIVYGWGFGADKTSVCGIRTVNHTAGNTYVYNCSLIGRSGSSGVGIQDGYSDVIAKNVLVSGWTDGFGGTFNAASNYNASDLAADAPGANSRNSQSFTFAAGTDNYHLASNDGGARNFGTDLSADAAYAFSTDFDGDTRTGTWDIGADEYVAAGGTLYFSTIAGTMTPAGGLLKHSATAKAGTLTTSGGLLKRTAKAFTGTLTTAGTLAAIKTVLLSLAGTLTTAGALVKQTGKPLAGALTTVGALLKQARKAFTGTLTSAGVLTSIKTILKDLGIATLSTAGALVRQTRRSVSGTMTTAGGLLKRTAKAFSGALTTAGILSAIRTVLLALTAVLSTAGALTKRTSTSLTGTLASAGAVVKRTARAFAGALTAAGALAASIVGALPLVRTLLATLRVSVLPSRDLDVSSRVDRDGEI